MAGYVLIRMGTDEAVVRLLEEKGEGIERPRRTEPDEFVRCELERRFEVCLVQFADAAVDPVGPDDDITITEASEVFYRALIVNRDAQILAAPLQYPKQRQT